MNTPGQLPLLHFSDLDDLLLHLPYGCPLVGVELDDRATKLMQFTHTPRAAYLLGAEDHGLSEIVRTRCHRLVRIETPLPESLNVACAGSILLHHRYIQCSA